MSKRVDWLAIQLEYEAGGVTLKELADKYQVSKRTVETHSAKGNWVQKARDASNQVADKARAEIAEKGATEIVSRFEVLNTLIEKCFRDAMGLEFRTAGEAIAALVNLLKYDDEYIHEWLLKKGYVAVPIVELETENNNLVDPFSDLINPHPVEPN